MKHVDLSSRNIFCKVHYLMDRIGAVYGTSEKPVLISGFWRSGTTWVQETVATALKAKTVFEPFDSNTLMPCHLRGDISHPACIPLTPELFDEADRHFLRLAFRGVAPRRSRFNYLCRKELTEAARRRVVVKFVRCQFLLDYLRETYGTHTPIHIVRHPQAVVASLLNTTWNWSFQDVDFRTLYQRFPADLFSEFGDFLDSEVMRHTESRIAFLWALSERAVRSASSVNIFSYEELMRNPDAEFRKLLITLGESNPVLPEAKQDSPVTEKNRRGLTPEERLFSWRNSLSTQQQERVWQTIATVWPEGPELWKH